MVHPIRLYIVSYSETNVSAVITTQNICRQSIYDRKVNLGVHLVLNFTIIRVPRMVDLLQVFVFLIPPYPTYMETLSTHYDGRGKVQHKNRD